ncbi:glycosyltransferase family 2 protein [Sulfuricurvum sp.]|uniref:glycosyltransferase family 2 protein n=1 Tax=Sulfuricurvum sp. TaxID=2025608 RepID=UPI00263A25D7|nr:glycosyltransferase family 2 protein [Sulfuricurvum sp.]MDD3597081.1 glycosyltransferase family 2 protein [Sulfuricurvum sp.]
MMFSIVIPLYNKEAYIVPTLKSVLAQTYQDFEIIVINDGSSDGSVQAASSLHDSRIRIITQPNGGVSSARNRGITEAHHELIAFLDADDFWDPDYLSSVFELYRQYPDCAVYAHNYRIMKTESFYHTPIIRGLPENFDRGIVINYFQIAAQSDPLLCSSTIVIKRAALNEIGKFPVGIRAGEDLLTWATLASRFDIAYTIRPKVTINRLGEEISSSPRKPDEHNLVGESLRALLDKGEKSRIHGLESYIAFWHKIRLSIFLRLGARQMAREEYHRMGEFAHRNLKYFIYGFLVYSPEILLIPFTRSVLMLNQLRRKLLSRSAQS